MNCRTCGSHHTLLKGSVYSHYLKYYGIPALSLELDQFIFSIHCQECNDVEDKRIAIVGESFSDTRD